MRYIDLSDLQDQIKHRIQSHADRNNLTFDEAKKLAKIKIAGHEFRLDIQSDQTQEIQWPTSTSQQE